MTATMLRARGVLLRYAGWAESSRWRLWVAIFVPVVGLYLLTLRTDIWDLSPDPTGVTPSAWALAHHGTPVLPRHLWPIINPWWVDVGGGNVVSNRTPGLIYLAAPFYWVMRFAGPEDVVPASIEAALLTGAAMGTLTVLVRRLATPRTALVTGLIAATATTTWAVSGTALWPHGPDQLFLCLAMLSLAAQASGRAGLAFAAAVLVRPSLAIVAAVTGGVQSWRARSLRPAVVIGAVTGLGLALFMLYSAHHWSVQVTSGGEAITRGAVNGTSTHGYEHQLSNNSLATWGGFLVKVLGALVSGERGVLVGAPFLLLLAPGLRAAWRDAPAWVRSSAVGGLLYLLVQLKAEVFTGGICFWSYRYTLETFTLCAPLLVLAWTEWTSRTPRRRAAFFALVSIAVSMQAVGAMCFRGPYDTSPWLFGNLVTVLQGPLAVSAIALLFSGVGVAALILRQGWRRTGASSPPREVVGSR